MGIGNCGENDAGAKRADSTMVEGWLTQKPAPELLTGTFRQFGMFA